MTLSGPLEFLRQLMCGSLLTIATTLTRACICSSFYCWAHCHLHPQNNQVACPKSLKICPNQHICSIPLISTRIAVVPPTIAASVAGPSVPPDICCQDFCPSSQMPQFLQGPLKLLGTPPYVYIFYLHTHRCAHTCT